MYPTTIRHRVRALILGGLAALSFAACSASTTSGFDGDVDQIVQALAKDPMDAKLNYEMARYYVATGALEEAKLQLTQNVQYNPDHVPSVVLLVDVLVKLNDIEGATALLGDLAATSPEQAKASLTKHQHRIAAEVAAAVEVGTPAKASKAALLLYKERANLADNVRASLGKLFVAMGHGKYDAGYLKDAISWYKKAAKVGYDKHELAFFQGRCYGLLGEDAHAEELFESFLDEKGENAKNYEKIGDFYVASFRFELGKKYLVKAYKKAKKPMVAFKIGKLALTLKKTDEAKEYFTKYVEGAPTPGAYLNAVKELLLFGDTSLALDFMHKGEKAFASFFPLYQVEVKHHKDQDDEAAILDTMGRYLDGVDDKPLGFEKAVTLLRELHLSKSCESLYAAKKGSITPTALTTFAAGICTLKEGKSKAAKTILEKDYITALGDAKLARKGWLEVGKAYLDNGFQADAERVLKAVVASSPTFVEGSLALAGLYRTQGDKDKEKAVIDALVTAVGSTPEVNAAVGRRYYALGEYELAAPYLLQGKKGCPECLKELGRIHLFPGMRDLEKARGYFDEYTATAPDKFAALKEVATFYGADDDLKPDLPTLYAKMIEADPTQIGVLLQIAKTYAESKDYVEAADALLQYIELDGPDKDLQAVATIAFELKDMGQRTKVFAKLGPITLSDPQLHKMLGDDFLARNDKALAYHHFKTYLELTKQSPSVIKHFADSLYSKKLYDVAIIAYKKAMGGQLLSSEYNFHIGRCYLKLNNLDKATSYFAKYVKSAPKKLPAKMRIANFYFSEKRYDKALTELKWVFDNEQGKNLKTVYILLSETMIKLGKTAGLEALSDTFVQRYPDKDDAYYEVIKTYESAGNRPMIVATVDKALEDNPLRRSLLQMLALQHLYMGNVDEATATLEKLVKLADDQFNERLGHAKELKSFGYLDAAEGFVQKALAQVDDDPGAYLLLGSIQLAMGKGAEADASFDKALLYTDDVEDTTEAIAGLLFETLDFERVVALYKKVGAQHPSISGFSLALGQTYLKLGYQDKATQAFGAYLAKNKSDTPAVSKAFAALGDFNTALSYYKKAIEMPQRQDFGDVMNDYLTAIIAGGKVTDIDQALMTYMTSDMDKAEAYRKIGEAYMLIGQLDKSVAALATSQSLSPVPGNLELMGRLYHGLGDLEKAKEHFLKFVEFPTGETSALQKGGVRLERLAKVIAFYSEEGDLSSALEVTELVSSMYTDNYIARYIEAELNFKLGKLQDGLDDLTFFIGHAQHLDEILPLAPLAINYSIVPEVVSVLRPVFEDKKKVELGLVLYRLLLHDGKLEDAAQVANVLVTKSATNVGTISYLIGKAAAMEGLPAIAEEHYTTALNQSTPATAAKAFEDIMKLGPLDERASKAAELEGLLAAVVVDKAAFHSVLSQIYKECHLYDQAMDHLDALAALAPTNMAVPVEKMFVAIVAGDDDEAIKAVDEALELSSKKADLLEELLAHADDRQSFAVAAHIVDKLYELDKSRASLLFHKGKYALLLGNAEAAKAAFDGFVSSTSPSSTSSALVANEYAKLGMTTEADAFLAYEPVCADDALAKATLLLMMDDEERASKSFDQALKGLPGSGKTPFTIATMATDSSTIPPEVVEAGTSSLLSKGLGLPTVYQALIAASFRAKDPIKAKANLDAYLAMGVMPWGGYYICGKEALAAGFVEESVSCFTSYTETAPLKKAALGRVIQTIIEHLRNDKDAMSEGQIQAIVTAALGILEELVAIDEPSVWNTTLKAELLDLAGDVDGAYATFKAWLAANPADAGAMNNLAYMLARHGIKLDEALSLVKSAITLEPDKSVFYLDTEGWILYQMGSYGDAKDKILASLRLVQGSLLTSLAESYYHLGMVEVARGATEEAIQAFTMATYYDPKGHYGKLGAQERAKLEKTP